MGQSDCEAQAWGVEGSGRRAVHRADQTPRSGEAGDVSGAGLHGEATELSGRDGRERRDADEPAAAPRRGRLLAPHRVRQRGQPAADTGHRSRARDGRPDVDWRRPPPPARAAADRKRAALARRRRARRPLRLPGHALNRRPDARVLRAERVARRDQHHGARFLARRVVADWDSVRARAGAADVEARHHRRAESRPQHGRRDARQPHAQPARGDRSGVVGRAARQCRPDGSHVPRARAHGRRHRPRSRAPRGCSIAAGQVRHARTAQPIWRGTAGPRGCAPRRRGGHVGPSVRQSAIIVHDRGTHT